MTTQAQTFARVRKSRLLYRLYKRADGSLYEHSDGERVSGVRWKDGKNYGPARWLRWDAINVLPDNDPR